jgi:hypothetical protein
MAKQSKARPRLPTMADFRKQLAAAPLVDVLGVLSAGGVGGGWSPGDTRWTMTFCFASWRIIGRELHSNELIVRREVKGEKEIELFRKLVQHNVVTRIRARVVEHSVWERSDALLQKVVGPDASDAEMNAEVERLQEPVRFKDKVFGTFTLDRTLNWFMARTTWNGRRIRLQLAACEPADLDRSLAIAYKLWRAQKTWQAKVSSYAVKELLPLKNGGWLGYGETKCTAAKFAQRMKLQWITVWPNGDFEFWHSGGDMFFGHDIDVSGSVAKGLRSAGLSG